METTDRDIIRAADAVRAAYLIIDPPSLLAGLDSCIADNSPIVELVGDVRAGLASVLSAATIPFSLTCSSMQHLRFQQFLTAARIRGLKVAAAASEIDEEAALKIAKSEMNQFLESEVGSNIIRDGVVFGLARGLQSENVANAASELLKQALVGTWSVFEVFASSLIVHVLNANPKLAATLVASDLGKQHFPKPAIGIEALEAHNFDASRSMGTLLFETKRLDNLTVIKDMIAGMFPDDDITAAMKDEALYLLNQRRHLIVHKRGVVDRDYLRRTTENIELGSKLAIKGADIELYVTTVCKIVAIISRSESLSRSLSAHQELR